MLHSISAGQERARAETLEKAEHYVHQLRITTHATLERAE